FSRLHKERTIQSNLHNLRKQLTAENLELLPEYHQRMAVLEHLGFVDPRTRTVQLKGRVACEINTCDEVLLTELVLNNLFADLDVPETVAVLSVLIFQEKNDLDSDLVERWPPRLIQALRQVRDTARRVMTIQAEFGIDGADPDLYLKTNLRYGLVEVVYEWARGLPFQQIMGLTNVLEGSIVRCIHRLEDTCREVRDAARLVGDGALYQKMDAAETAIKRDIVFCGSLYL
ncbi:DEAD/DEAH box RNA helicase, partial [Catenaria anguillulae PL171]